MIPERIIFVSRGITVYIIQLYVYVRKLTAGEAPVRQNTATRITTDLRIMLLDVMAQGADSMWNLTSSPLLYQETVIRLSDLIINSL